MRKIAIVIPYYKKAFFDKTLASLAAQTDQRFNTYIFDDGSPESCLDLVDKHFGNKNKIYYRRFEKNIGQKSLVQHWKRCLSKENLLNEEWIMLLGDDDILDKETVSLFYKNIEQIGARTNVVRYASCIIDNEDQVISHTFTHPIWEKGKTAIYKKILGFSRSSFSEYIFRCQAYEKIGFREFPLAWYTDDAFWLDMTLEKEEIFTINEASIKVRVGNNSISGSIDNLELKEKAKRAYFFFVLEYYNERFQAVQLRNIIWAFELSFIGGINVSSSEKIKFLNCCLKYGGIGNVKNAIKTLLLNGKRSYT